MDADTRTLWEPEIARCQQSIRLLENETKAWLDTATSCRNYAPELVQGYIDLAKQSGQRADDMRSRLRKINDYLAGKINAWW